MYVQYIYISCYSLILEIWETLPGKSRLTGVSSSSFSPHAKKEALQNSQAY